jgi:predicted transcriptional regulator
MSRLNVRNESLESFRSRVLADARALDRGEALASESTVSFGSLQEMIHVLTPLRVTLLESIASSGAKPVNLLARDLRRKRESVMRDVSALRKLGFLSTGYDANRVFIARPTASRYEFVCQVGHAIPSHEHAKLSA